MMQLLEHIQAYLDHILVQINGNLMTSWVILYRQMQTRISKIESQSELLLKILSELKLHMHTQGVCYMQKQYLSNIHKQDEYAM